MKPITVVLVDDHLIIRRGLLQMLGEYADLDMVGEAGDSSSALHLIRQLRPQVVLLDIALGDRDGLDLLRTLRQEFPRLGVIMLSVYAETQFALRSIRSGASAYLNKGCSADELHSAICRVASGRLHITPAVAELMAHDVRRDHSQLPHEQLSNREFQVLQRLAQGHSVAAIAGSLSLSSNTISTYRSRILAKLGLHGTAELVAYALRHGVLQL